MRSKFYYISAILIITMAAVGCAKNSGGEGGTSGCVPLPEGDVVWTFEECGPLTIGDFVHLTPSSEGHIPSATSSTGFVKEKIGFRSISKGRMTWVYSDFDYSLLPFPADDHILGIFKAQSANHQNGLYWTLFALRFGVSGNVVTKLVSQREGGDCIPDRILNCEKNTEVADAPLYSSGTSYRFDCWWDSTVPSEWGGQSAATVDGTVECAIYDNVSGAQFSTLRVPTSGDYPSIDTIMVGGRTSQGFGRPNANVKNTLTNFRMTIFRN